MTYSTYLASLLPEVPREVRKLRAAIRAAAPGAVDGISYGIPCITLAGKPVVWYAGRKKHTSMYPIGAPFLRALSARLWHRPDGLRDLKGYHQVSGHESADTWVRESAGQGPTGPGAQRRKGTRMRRAVVTLVWLMAWVPLHAAVQGVPAPAPERADVIAAAKDVMQKARYCTLVTIADDGHPRARIVDPLSPDAAFHTWIATNPLTRKVNDIQRDPRVTLLCFDAGSSSYVSILGRATVVTDAAERATHWKEEWSPIYPLQNGKRDFALIHLVPTRLEIVSTSRSMVRDTKTWLPIAIEMTEATPPSTDEQLIRAARARSNAAIVAHDPAAIAREWMENVHVVSSTSAQVAGREQNRRRMATQFANRPDTIYIRQPSAVDVNPQWAVASERGEWTGRWTEPDGAMEIGGTYLVQWRRVDGRWLIQAELYVPTHCAGSTYCNQRP